MNTPENATVHFERSVFEAVHDLNAAQTTIDRLIHQELPVYAAVALWAGLGWSGLWNALDGRSPTRQPYADSDREIFREVWTERLRPIIGDMRLACDMGRRAVPEAHLRALGLMR